MKSKPEQKQTGTILHFNSDVVLAENARSSVIEVLREGVIRDRGFVVTRKMLTDYVKHFDDGTYGSKIRVAIGHSHPGGDDEAAGWFSRLFTQVDKESGKMSLMGEVEWTELGVEKLTKKLYQFVSAELSLKYPNAKDGKTVENVFTGAVLTNSPALKMQEPIALNEDERNELTHQLTMLKALIENLSARALLSKEDVELAKKMLDDAPADQVKELSEAVSKLEVKFAAQEKKLPAKGGEGEPDADDMTDDEKEAYAAMTPAQKKLYGKKMSSKKLADALAAEGINLADVKTQAQKLKELQEKDAKRDLAEFMESKLMLSEEDGESAVGFRSDDETRGKLEKFLLSLRVEQREEFAALMEHVVSVDFTVRGSTERAITGDLEDQVVALSERLYAEKFSVDMGMCQKEAARRIKAGTTK